MRNTKLFLAIGSLSKSEANRFRKFLQSPYFNTNQNLLQLFELMVALIEDNGATDISKEDVWNRLSIDMPYNDVRFRKYCSDLLKLFEEFLAQEVFEEAPLQRDIFLMQAIGRKKLNKLKKTAIKTAQNTLQSLPHRSPEYYYFQYAFEKNYWDLMEQEYDRASKGNIEDIGKQLDIFFMSEKLKWYCDVISRQEVALHNYDIALINEIVTHIQDHNYEEYPPVAIYFQIYKILSNPEDTDHYFKLKELLSKYGLLFPENEAFMLYNSAMNYCIQKFNKQSRKEFLRELFDLTKDLIEKEVFPDDELSPWVFRNSVVTALRLGEYDWAESFINNYHNKIPLAYRENARTFNLATLFFYKKEYNKVIELLQEVEYDDFTYNLNSKTILILTYYETDEIEPLYSLFESFRAYLNRHKDIPQQRREYYTNLIKFTRKLTKLTPGDQKALARLKKEVEETKNIASIGWLKEKIAELEG